jgi:hypothetical protein
VGFALLFRLLDFGATPTLKFERISFFKLNILGVRSVPLASRRKFSDHFTSPVM